MDRWCLRYVTLAGHAQPGDLKRTNERGGVPLKAIEGKFKDIAEVPLGFRIFRRLTRAKASTRRTS
jgi:hypothetical protein